MKLETYDQKRAARASHQKRVPLWTLEEIAADLGVPYRTLTGCMSQDDAAPPVVIDGHKLGFCNRKKRYDPVAVRAWWRARA
jgi:hypothetical protein